MKPKLIEQLNREIEATRAELHRLESARAMLLGNDLRPEPVVSASKARKPRRAISPAADQQMTPAVLAILATQGDAYLKPYEIRDRLLEQGFAPGRLRYKVARVLLRQVATKKVVKRRDGSAWAYGMAPQAADSASASGTSLARAS